MGRGGGPGGRWSRGNDGPRRMGYWFVLQGCAGLSELLVELLVEVSCHDGWRRSALMYSDCLWRLVES